MTASPETAAAELRRAVEEADKDARFAEKQRLYWIEQRARMDLLLDDETAVVSRRTFDALDEYSTSMPSGVFDGKVWKRRCRGDERDEWWLGEYFDDGVPGRMAIRWRVLLVLE